MSRSSIMCSAGLDNLRRSPAYQGNWPGWQCLRGSSSGIYRTTDGYVAIAAGSSELVWRRFCHTIGQAALLQDPRFATTAARRDHRDDTVAIIQAWTGVRTKAEVVQTMSTARVPAAPVNNVAEMVADTTGTGPGNVC